MDLEAINAAVKAGVEAGVKAALEDKLKPFYIDRETHWKQHQFLSEWMEWSKQCKSIVMRTIVGAVVMVGLVLMGVGFVFKYGGK